MAQLNADSTDFINEFDSEAVVNVLVMGVTGGIGIDQRSFDNKKRGRDQQLQRQRQEEEDVHLQDRESETSTVPPGEAELRL